MSDDTDFEQPVRAISPEILENIRRDLSMGAPLRSVFYRVRTSLPRGYSLHRFEQQAAAPGTPLYYAVQDGIGSFEAAFSEKIWSQMEDGTATAPKVIQERQRQSEIDAALAREFPHLFTDPENP